MPRTIVEFAQTFPNHTSLFTGRPATGPNGHGVDFNVDDGSTIHSHAGTYISSIFDVAHDHGLATSFYTQKTKMAFLIGLGMPPRAHPTPWAQTTVATKRHLCKGEPWSHGQRPTRNSPTIPRG